MNIGTLEALIYGFLVGLFANYIADVMPKYRKLTRAEWWPVRLEGLKRYFRRRRVYILTIVTMLASILLTNGEFASWPYWQLGLVFTHLAIVVVIDIENRAIMHPISLAGVLLFGGIGISWHGWIGTLIGGVSGFIILLGMYGLGAMLARWMAKRRGGDWDEPALGFGDVILAGVLGLLLGWPGIVGGLFWGVISSGIYSGLFILWGLIRGNYKAFATIPYGPFLALGAIAMITIAVYF
jgi:leader peptidase (prepilin peptidase)/N-methyltransferase